MESAAGPGPSTRQARRWRITIALAYIALGSALAVVLLLRMAEQHPIAAAFGFPGFQIPLAIGFGAAGAAILRRRPGNVIGVLLLAEGVVSLTQFLVESTPRVLRDGGADDDLIAWIATFANVMWVPSVLLVGLLLALFPDGRRIPGRWSVAPAALVVGGVASIAGQLMQPGPLHNYRDVTNPLGVGGPWPVGVESFVYLLFVVPLGVAAVSLVVRWRRSTGDVREQLKWLAFASIPFAVGGFVSLAYPIGSYVMIAAGMAMPVAIAIAVLRYRLYDIDELVSRTFVYGALTAILAGVYTGALKFFNELFVQVTGTESEGSIILATLVLAAAFTPVRKALEAVIDRRFKQKAGSIGGAAGPPGEAASAIDLDRLDAIVRRAVREELEAFGAIPITSPVAATTAEAQAPTAQA